MNQNAHKQIIINDFNELKKVKLFIKSFGEMHNIKEEFIPPVQLALEELIVNIISYSYKDQKTYTIQLKAELNQNKLTLYLTNKGKAFNPITYKNPDIHKNLTEREIGGLGILLAKNLVDDISYAYQDGCNKLTLKKNIK